MPDLFKPLFSPKLLARRLTGFDPTMSPELTAIADQWSRTAADPAFLKLNEKPLQGQFLTDIFAHLLGFVPAVGHLEAYNLKPESASTEVKGARTPDARLGFITSGTFSNANFAAPFRAYFMRGTIPDSIADAVVADGIECDVSVLTRSEWRFQPAAINNLFARLVAIETDIDDHVYHLFGLTAADRLLLADHSHHAMIDYPYGAV